MRVVYLNPSAQLGGAETSLLALLGALLRRRPAPPDLSVVLAADGPLVRQLSEMDIRVDVLPFPNALAAVGENGLWGTQTVKAAFEVRQYVANLSRLLTYLAPDVVDAAGFKMHVLSAWSRLGNVPLVWHVHDFVGRRRVMKQVFRQHARCCSLAIANSRSVAEDLQTICPKLPIEVVYNAVDDHRFTPQGNTVDLDALSGMQPATLGTVKIGLVATFARWKGHRVFLEALARLRPSLPVRGYIIGGPIYQTAGSQVSFEELREEIVRLGLSDRVGLTGFIEDSAAALRSLDIVVHASTDPEPFGMVAVEAMASGKPVVVSLAGGAAEIVRDGETGLGHRPGDVAGLASQLQRLIDCPQLRDTLAESGRRFVNAHFSQDRLAATLQPLYERLVNNRADMERQFRSA